MNWHYIHHPAIDVSEFFEAEKPGTVGRIVEDIALSEVW